MAATVSLPTNKLPSESIQSEHVIDPDYNIPEVQEAPEIPYAERDSPTHAYAVDVSFRTTLSDMGCLREKGYKTVFVRALNPFGYFDREVLNTINNAYQAGLGSEIYITPQINSTRTGAEQISLVYQNLRDNGVYVRSLWIQVASPINWIGSVEERIQFIEDMLQRARNLGLSAGIYTSFYDWLELTGGWNSGSSDVLLWYWHVLGTGVTGESNTTLEDFRPFGKWSAAAVKQFGQVEKVCGMIVNRNVYATRTTNQVQINTEKENIRVGGIGI
uniref:Lysozyme n=1 Tax=Caenorhabditis japonica TaxID=281687 RepID=A0A8R1DVD1_CAEJA